MRARDNHADYRANNVVKKMTSLFHWVFSKSVMFFFFSELNCSLTQPVMMFVKYFYFIFLFIFLL